MAVPHDFAAGDVLTAAQMDTIANRVVTDTTSGARPTTVHEGMTIVETDTNRTMLYDGSGWVAAGQYDRSWCFIAEATPSAAIVSFTSIPATFTHLEVVLVGRGNAAVTYGDMLLRLNADTGANYDRQYHSGLGATASSGVVAAQTSATMGAAPGTSGTASKAGFLKILIPDYAATSFHKIILTNSGLYDSGVRTNIEHDAIGYRSTTAISQIDIHFNAIATGWVSGTKATLLGQR